MQRGAKPELRAPATITVAAVGSGNHLDLSRTASMVGLRRYDGRKARCGPEGGEKYHFWAKLRLAVSGEGSVNYGKYATWKRASRVGRVRVGFIIIQGGEW